MRTKLATVALAGTLGLTGLAGATLLSPSLSYAASGVTTAVTDRATSIAGALQGLVSNGTISQAQADKVASTLAAAEPEHGPGGFGGHRGGGRLDLATAATTLKLTEAQLRTQLDAGTTLAQVADAQGIAQSTLVDALVSAAKARLADAVAAGRITQAQADARSATLPADVTEQLTKVCAPGGGGGRHGRPNDGDADDTAPSTGSTAPSSPSPSSTPSTGTSNAA